MIRVSVPASSANLGSGFDVLGMALSLPFEVATARMDGFRPAERTHPAAVAFARLRPMTPVPTIAIVYGDSSAMRSSC